MEKLLTISPKERDKLKLMHDLEHCKTSRSAAAGRVGISERYTYRLYGRYRKIGDEAVIQGLLETHPNCDFPLKVRTAAGRLCQARLAPHGQDGADNSAERERWT